MFPKTVIAQSTIVYLSLLNTEIHKQINITTGIIVAHIIIRVCDLTTPIGIKNSVHRYPSILIGLKPFS